MNKFSGSSRERKERKERKEWNSATENKLKFLIVRLASSVKMVTLFKLAGSKSFVDMRVGKT